MCANLIDPLKLRTYGVKKPLEEKEQKIQELYEQNKRYYPKMQNGQIDEWGAVIKHQTEIFEREKQLKAEQDAVRKREYYDQIQKEINMRSQQKDVERMNREGEARNMQQKAEESMHYQQAMKAQEQQLKNHLLELNKRQMDEYQQRLKATKHNEQIMGQQLAQQAEQDLQKQRGLDRMKKEEYSNALKQEIEQRNKLKQLQNLIQNQQQQETQHQMNENAQKQMQREMDYKQRFNKFNDDQAKKHELFQSAQNNHRYQEIQKLQQNHLENPQNAMDAHHLMQQERKNVIKQNYDVVKKQMEDKEKLKQLEKQLYQIDKNNSGIANSQSQMMDQILQDDKKRRQQMYKELLDTQLSYNKELQGYGNMTDVEKKINRQDLLAYKNFDNQQYAMIPGVNSQKKHMEDYQPKGRQVDLNEQQKRMQNFGYNRDVRYVERGNFTQQNNNRPQQQSFEAGLYQDSPQQKRTGSSSIPAGRGSQHMSQVMQPTQGPFGQMPTNLSTSFVGSVNRSGVLQQAAAKNIFL